MSDPEAIKDAGNLLGPGALPEALQALLNVPTYISGANTVTYRISDLGEPYVSGGSIRTRSSAATEVADIRALAEGLMFDSTKLVSIIEAQQQALQPQEIVAQTEELVPVVKVLRGGAALVGSFALVCSTGSILSGTTLIHPLLSAILFISSLGFFAMSLVPSEKKYGSNRQ
jgi:hypothetical protein